MTRSLVTGATGFVGAHLVRALLERGESVRCLVRASSRRSNLEGLAVELAEGDVRERESVLRAIEGCDGVYHCAADYRLYARDPAELYRTNVDGTENVLAASASAGVAKIVYTSSVATMGKIVGHYKRSKLLAERVAVKWAQRGLPVVIVNPSTPIGELDVKPTPTGRIIVDFLAGRIPAWVDTGLNVVDVRDVAAGHILANERGAPGERYVLAHRNVTLKELLFLLAEVSGRRPPWIELPHLVPLAFAAVDQLWARATGREPRVPLEGVRMSMTKMFFDGTRAREELGMPQSPIEPALARAVAWFHEHGYA
jgi:dihydroflavonol-4-reductase